MSNKTSSEQAFSHLSSKLKQLRQNCIEHQTFQVYIKRQSVLFSNWKPITMTLIQTPNEQLLVTLRKQKQAKIHEIVNISHSRISKKLGKVEKYYCFGVIIPSNRKYLFAANSQEQTLDIYNKLNQLKREIRLRSSELSDENTGDKEQQRQIIVEENEELQFEKSNNQQEGQKYMSSTNQRTPQKETNYNIRQMQMQIEEDQEQFRTAYQDASVYQQPLQASLQLQQPISEQQIQCLLSDQGFKLLQNFNNGRFLTKSQQSIKINLLIASSLKGRELIQLFFHLELWNSKIKSYSIVNRIDKGIYLAKIQFHRRNLFSLPKYCYVMVNTWRLNGDDVLIFRSLDQNHFQKQLGYSWINLNFWLRVHQSHQEKKQTTKLMNICAKVESQGDFSTVLAIFGEIKSYQTFLKTTGNLPHPTLQWKDQIEI